MEIVQLEKPALGVPRDGYGRPLIVPKTGGKPVAHTRTTTFIDVIEDKGFLSDWDKRCVLIGAATDLSILKGVLDIDKDAPAGKTKLNALAEKAKDASGANLKREAGTHLHALSELVDAGRELPSTGVSEADLNDMASYRLETLDFEVIHVEKLVVVSELGVAGTPDRVSRYEGPGPLFGEPISGTFITDYKSGTVDYGALKMSSQLAIYSRGEFYDHTIFPVDVSDGKAFTAWKKTVFPADLAATAYTPQGDVNRQWGVIMNVPAGSGECTLYWANLTVGWELAKLALQIRKARAIKGALIPFHAEVV